MSKEHIGIIELRSKSVKRLDAVTIPFNKTGTTLIEGPNAQGKSSVLDSLLYALLGKGAVAEQPIHNGKDEAVIELTLTNGKRIRRTFKRKGEDEYTTAIELYGADGAKFGSPQSTINDWLGSDIAFDPLDFAYMDGKRRREVLAQLVGVDLDGFAARRKAAYDKRQAHYGLYDAAKRKFETAVKPGKIEGDMLDVAALNAELSAALELQGQHATAKRLLDEAEAKDTRLFAEIKDLEERLKAKQAERTANLDEVKKAKAAVDAYEVPDIAAIQAKLGTADQHNNALREAKRAEQDYNAAKAEWDTRKAERDAFDKELESIDAERSAALGAATYPVDGITFGDDDVLLNGLPFEQASTAEKIKVGMGVAIALNPTLRVIVSHDGALLDKSNLALINDLAQANGFQVVLERVADEPGAGIFIVDGAVANG